MCLFKQLYLSFFCTLREVRLWLRFGAGCKFVMNYILKCCVSQVLDISSFIFFTAKTSFCVNNFLLFLEKLITKFFKIQIVDFLNFHFSTKNFLRNPKFPPRLSGDLQSFRTWVCSCSMKMEHHAQFTSPLEMSSETPEGMVSLPINNFSVFT